MPVETEGPVRPLPPPTGEQVGHTATVNAGAGEPAFGQQVLQQDQRAAFDGRDGRAADQIGGQGDGINHGMT